MMPEIVAKANKMNPMAKDRSLNSFVQIFDSFARDRQIKFVISHSFGDFKYPSTSLQARSIHLASVYSPQLRALNILNKSHLLQTSFPSSWPYAKVGGGAIGVTHLEKVLDGFGVGDVDTEQVEDY